jgi:hypothetical protein
MRGSRHIITVGETFNRWMTVSYIGNGKNVWLCRCSCGTEQPVAGASLVSGWSKSCGCLKSEVTAARMTTHGKFGTPLYKLWNSVVMRCHSPTGAYFGRFTVCEEWRTFEPFEKWCLENNYETGLQIDRRNNKLGYSPENCRFVTRRVNCNNKDNNRLLTIFGETKTLTEWSRDPRCAAPGDGAFENRVLSGWALEEALTTPSARAAA